MAATPMMQQYEDAKRACPGAILLFRMGDFYELFHDDAKVAAGVLGLTLTSRDKGENPIPMAGFPHHQLESYLGKLIASGHRAAVCDQVEDPRQAKGLVRREVTRIVTPGTLLDDALLDPRASNFLAALALGGAKQPHLLGLAWLEPSAGKFLAAQIPLAHLADELARIAPAECLLAESVPTELADALPAELLVTRRPDWAFAHKAAAESLARQFGAATLEGFGFSEDETLAVSAAGAILDYLQETQKAGLPYLKSISPYRAGDNLEIDQATRRSLELTSTIREGRREGSLLGVLDRTVTAMGSRLLADWLSAPLTDLALISARHDAVEEFLAQAALLDAIRDHLKDVYDLQRLLARITSGRASPRDLAYVARTLGGLPPLKAKLSARESQQLNQLESQLDLCPQLHEKLQAALEEDCPLTARGGGIIRPGYSEKLDALRELARGGKQWIAQYQQQEIERTGITSLKVGFNKVFGYYLEVTNTHRDKIPAEYIRKQTLKNAERYITPQLKEYEEKVLTADEKSQDLEYELFLEVRDLTAAAAERLQATADALAELDVLAALALLARQRGYTRPEIVEDSVLEILDGRHPVLDVIEPEGTFVPNDTHAGGDEEGHILLITGPNMAGKSTYIRQVALITLMAQLGGFVPARKAVLGLADRIFARVGASDELSRGHSTFMVEMTETARILNTSTSRSLVILDEIGRGTSTYDGVSLAWSVVEYLHEHIGCRTLFATHYHELTDLARTLTGIKNLNVAVREWEEEVVFLHKIVEGAADKSYGIYVARLAGVPPQVLQRAKEILWQLEEEHVDSRGQSKLAAKPVVKNGNGQLQLTLFEPTEHPLMQQLRQLDLNQLTPIAAIQQLQAWQNELTGQQSKPR